MKKAVTYSVVRRKKPGATGSEPLYYAQAQARAEMSLEEMAERIEAHCTVTHADAVAVLTALEDQIIEGLQKGEIIRLGKIGNFQVMLSSKGSHTLETFNETLLKKPRITFRATSALRSMTKKLSYERVPQLPKKEKTEPDAPVQGGSDQEQNGEEGQV